MRKCFLILALAASVPFVASAGITPAKAEIVYPYCTAETRWDGPHCNYRTLDECVAAVAGLAYTCMQNPWYFGAQVAAKRHAR